MKSEHFLRQLLITSYGYRIVIGTDGVKAYLDNGEEVADFDGDSPENVLFLLLEAMGHKPEWA